MDDDQQQKPAQPVAKRGIVAIPGRIRSLAGRIRGLAGRRKKAFLLSSLLVLIVVVGLPAAYLYRSHNARKNSSELSMLNKSLQANDEAKALEHARNALKAAPNDMDTILAAANITAKYNPDEAKQLYVRALNVFKKQDNPDKEGKRATTYWAAAGLAEQAGLNDQAKQYYQKAIDAADMKDSYDQYIANDSQTALARLR